MGFLNNLINSVGNQAKNAAQNATRNAVNGAVNNAVQSAINGGKPGTNRSETFVFSGIPADVNALMSLPEASLDTPYKTTALVMLAMLQYENNPELCFAMIDALRGPAPMSPADKAFIKERLDGKTYKVKSFFAGATVQNNYTPSNPLTIVVSENPYSYLEPNWATMFVQSAGADSPRQIKLRLKPSTNQWFINDIQVLADIRVPVSADPWA